MKVLCRYNKGLYLPVDCLDDRGGYTLDKEFPLTIDKEYVVYGVTVESNHAWYYLLDDDKLSFPIWYPAPLFELVSGDVPAGWKFGHHAFGPDHHSYVLSFPEWADDGGYYERLLDGDAHAEAVFQRWRGLLEAPRPLPASQT